MGIPTTFLAFLWHFVKKQRLTFTLLLITGFIWSLNETSFSYFIKLIVNRIDSFEGNKNDIYPVLTGPIIGLVVIRILMEVGMRIQGILSLYIFPQFKANIRESVYSYLKGHSLSYFHNNYAGSISNKLGDIPDGSEMVMETFLYSFFPIGLAFLISVALMWMAQPLFGGIILIWFFMHMSIAIYHLPTAADLLEIHSESVNTLNAKMMDSLSNILTVHLFSRGNYESRYLKKFQTEEIKKAKKAMWHLERMEIMQGVAVLILILSMIFILIYGWTKGWVSLGDFTLISMLSFNIAGHVWFLSYELISFTREASKVKNALSLISTRHNIIDKPNAKILKVPDGEIIFENVTFYYKKDKNIFTDINLKIPAKQKVGLVGLSGSGKSTFANLILRFYDINSGKILIDGTDISNVTQLSLREKISMIPQEPALFHRTVIENIRYGQLDASDEDVIAAAKLAHCHEFIMQMDNNYSTLVGERGGKLSGGQKQRIAIARAILKNAPILILDEATSALDSITEKLIEESLGYLMRTSTSIVIAHRLSTLLNMDRLLVFDQGKIIEDGSMEELLKAKGHFYKLWNIQLNGLKKD